MTDTTLEEIQLKEMRLKLFGNTEDTSKDDIFLINLKDAKNIALNTLYPFNLDVTTLPSRIAENWQVRCAVELYNAMGTEGYTAYAENGLSWQRASELVSSKLMNELTPKADRPR